MRKHIFSLLVSVAAYAAAETPDIPAASPDSTAATAPEPVLPGLPAAIIYGTEYVPSCLLSDDEVARRFAFDAPSYSPLITSWRSGAVWAEGGSASLPGMAGVESGTINATHRQHIRKRLCRRHQIRVFPRSFHAMAIRRHAALAVRTAPRHNAVRFIFNLGMATRHVAGDSRDDFAPRVRRIPFVGHHRALRSGCRSPRPV